MQQYAELHMLEVSVSVDDWLAWFHQVIAEAVHQFPKLRKLSLTAPDAAFTCSSDLLSMDRFLQQRMTDLPSLDTPLETLEVEAWSPHFDWTTSRKVLFFLKRLTCIYFLGMLNLHWPLGEWPCTHLREVSFIECGLTAESMPCVAEALRLSSNLILFDITYNKIGDEGLVQLASALQQCKQLQTLHRSDCRLTSKSIPCVEEALGCMCSLHSLELFYNNLNDNGLRHVIQRLQNCTQLTKLNIGGTAVTSQSLQTVAMLLQATLS